MDKLMINNDLTVWVSKLQDKVFMKDNSAMASITDSADRYSLMGLAITVSSCTVANTTELTENN